MSWLVKYLFWQALGPVRNPVSKHKVCGSLGITAYALWPLYLPAHTCTYPALSMYLHLHTHVHVHTKQTNTCI